MRQYWPGPVPPFLVASAAAYVSSSTIADVSPAPQCLLPAGFLEGSTEIELWACGQFSTTATPTLLMGFYYGGVAGVALGATTAMTCGTATAWPWQLYYKGRVRLPGSTGSIVGQGWCHLGTSLTVASLNMLPATAAARTVTIDTTTAKTITCGATWGTLSASNTLTCDEFFMNVLN